MNIRLTNVGLRYVMERVSTDTDVATLSRETQFLHKVFSYILKPADCSVFEQELIDRGFLELVPEHADFEETVLRYQHNPLENITTINFEMTTRCNLNCLHCRSGIVKRTTETNLDALKEAADLFLSLGVTGFIFIGGEVSKYADGWLELVSHIRDSYEASSREAPGRYWGGLRIGLLTSGWWMGQTSFAAAGTVYEDDRAYLKAMKQAGLTHLLFSIDGPETLHDRWRRVPGLYRRIMDGIPRVREAWLVPRVSLVLHSKEHDEHGYAYLEEIADLCMDLPHDMEPAQKISALLEDKHTMASNFVDINNGVQLSQREHALHDINPNQLRCKAFFRPAPKLTISASGELAICPLMNAAEAYGNIHRRPLTSILNTMHDNLLFRLHANWTIKDYLPHMDTSIFGEAFDHLCSLRTIVNLLAKKMDAAGLSPDSVTAEDGPTLARINREVARWTGHLKWQPSAQ